MNRLPVIALFFLSSLALFGQGFTRDIKSPFPCCSFSEYYGINQIHFGESEQDLVLWYNTSYDGYGEVFIHYNARTNTVEDFRHSQSGPARARYIRYGSKQYVVRNGSGGAPSARPYWEFIDFEGNKNSEFYPNYRGASSLAQRNDSLFLLYAPLNNPIVDTNTLYYLSYLNPIKGREEFLDSIRIPFYLSNAGLYYHQEENYWEVFHEDYRIHFKLGNGRPDTLYQDPRFALEHFRKFGGDPNLVRETYFRRGLKLDYRNYSAGKLYRIIYTPFDTSYYDLSVLNFVIPDRDFGTPFSGAFPGLSNLTKNEGVLDIKFTSPYYSSGIDTLFAYRIANGAIQSQLILPFATLGNYRGYIAKSTSEGGFYIAGHRYSQYPNGYPQAQFLIYSDPDGKMKTMPDGELINIHFNRSSNTINIFYEDPDAQLRYRIVDVSGRRMQEGECKVHEGISIGNWRSGLYYLQLWSKDQSYLGQRTFLIQPE